LMMWYCCSLNALFGAMNQTSLRDIVSLEQNEKIRDGAPCLAVSVLARLESVQSQCVSCHLEKWSAMRIQ
jgi:hypothetical protein